MRHVMYELKTTNRGFSLIEFTDVRGTSCSLQKSSLAFEDCIWFGVNDVSPQHFVNGKLEPVRFPPDTSFCSRMHLTQDHVKQIMPYFNKLLESPFKVNKNSNLVFIDRYDDQCSLRAFYNLGWIALGIDDPNPQILSNGWQPVEYPSDTIFITRMILGQEHVKSLMPYLNRFIKTGNLYE